MWRSFFSPFVCACLATVFVLSSLHIAGAQVMQSTNYQIQSDSINIGGGFSSSSNFALESTVGEVGTGNSNSTNYSLRAGYQQMHEVYIAISNASDVTLSPTLSGITGGTSNGTTTVTVTTDSSAGYSLSIAASDSPAMKSVTHSIADYVPAGAPPDFTFTTGATQAHFGFSPEGADVVTRFKDNGSACNLGSSNTSFACWDGLSTSEEMIASNTNSNHPAGTPTIIRYRVGIGGSVTQAEGTYTATTTLTALPL